MKLNYMSDIHTEFDKPFKDFLLNNTEAADVLVLAGDIETRGGVYWLKQAAQHYKYVIYVFGNHEYYNEAFPDIRKEVKKEFKGTNINLLENSSVELEGVRFHGATLWTDCGNYNPITINRVDGELNDFRRIHRRVTGTVESFTEWEKDFIRFTAQYSTEVHKETVVWLERVVHPNDVVITHHAPSYGSLHPRYKYDTKLNAAYMSEMTKFILKAKPQVWFHGHVHQSFDYMEGETRILCNPRGYVGYEENPSFNKEAIYIVK